MIPEIEADAATAAAGMLVDISLGILADVHPDADRTSLAETAYMTAIQSIMQTAQARGVKASDCVAILANAAGWLLAHMTDPSRAVKEFLEVTVAVLNEEMAPEPNRTIN